MTTTAPAETPTTFIRGENPHRVLYRVTVHIVEPWAVGTLNDDPNQAPILEDPREGGVPYVPATSLVGSLRRHLDDASRWLDNSYAETQKTPKPDGKPEPITEASRTLVTLGTRISPTSTCSIDTKKSTAINPETGAAKTSTLRYERLVPASATKPTIVDWYLEQPGELDDVLLQQLRTWQPIIGRRRTVGRGRAHVKSVRTIEVDLNDPDDLTWWLTGRHDWLAGGSANAMTETPHDGATALKNLEHHVFGGPLHFTVRDAIHVGTGETTPDTNALAVARDPDGNPIIPGTSWKGVIRARARYIAHSVFTESHASEIITNLFGPEPESLKPGGPGGKRGKLTFGTSVFCTDAPTETFTRTHVAIDRFTGGALPTALYSVEAIPAGATSTLAITSSPSLDDAEKNLLAWVLRDFQDGLIGIGGMTTRGYGSIELTNPPSTNPIDTGGAQ